MKFSLKFVIALSCFAIQSQAFAAASGFECSDLFGNRTKANPPSSKLFLEKIREPGMYATKFEDGPGWFKGESNDVTLETRLFPFSLVPQAKRNSKFFGAMILKLKSNIGDFELGDNDPNQIKMMTVNLEMPNVSENPMIRIGERVKMKVQRRTVEQNSFIRSEARALQLMYQFIKDNYTESELRAIAGQEFHIRDIFKLQTIHEDVQLAKEILELDERQFVSRRTIAAFVDAGYRKSDMDFAARIRVQKLIDSILN